MKKLSVIFFVLVGFIFHAQAQGAVCPDPNTSALQWGIVLPPWHLDPFSENAPQGEPGTVFVRAYILVAGIGRGVVCTYRNSLGPYSIGWLVGVKIPPNTDMYWRNNLAGFDCTESIETCVFYTAEGASPTLLLKDD